MLSKERGKPVVEGPEGGMSVGAELASTVEQG